MAALRVKVLFYAINGTGLGHLTRLLAIARPMRELLRNSTLCGRKSTVLSQAIWPLERHRVTKNQVKADYAPFKRVDKERGRKARDPLEEAGSYDTSADPMGRGDLDSDDGSFGFWHDDVVVAAAVGGAVYYSSTSSHEFGDLS